MTIDNEVLYEKYNIDIELYRGMSIDFGDLRTRTANCLKGAGIFDLDNLLSMSYDKLSRIKSLGMLSLNDIEEYVKRLDSKTEKMMEKMDIFMTSRIKNRRDLIYSGEFTEELYEGINECEQRTIDELKRGFELLDHALIVLCRDNPAFAYNISSMLKRFTMQIEKYKELDKLYDAVKGKINNHLKPYYEVYPMRELISEEFKNYCNDGSVLLGSLLFDKAMSSTISTEEKIKFVKWASYDLKEELTSFLNGFYERSANTERVLILRARKCTLQEIGDELGITRERVRQIEKKVVQPFCRWQRNKKFLPRLSAEFNGETIIESTELQEYFDDATEVLLYLLQCADDEFFSYDCDTDTVIIVDDDITDFARDYVEKMPDELDVASVEEYKNKATDEHDIPIDCCPGLKNFRTIAANQSHARNDEMFFCQDTHYGAFTCSQPFVNHYDSVRLFQDCFDSVTFTTTK